MMTLTVRGLFGLFILLGYTSTPAKGQIEGDLRLRDGISSSDGHVEIYSSTSKEWVSICSDNWDEKEARVVCRQLGKDTSEVTAGKTLFLLSNYWPSEFTCQGKEPKLTDCSSTQAKPSDCLKRATVICGTIGLSMSKGIIAAIVIGSIIFLLFVVGVIASCIKFCLCGPSPSPIRRRRVDWAF